jgi:hypothetical protein
VQVLTKPFNLKGIITNKVNGTMNINAVEEFTKKITKYSELISNSKKTSAANSISSLLSKTLDHEQKMSTSEERNSTTNRNYFTNTRFKYKSRENCTRKI